MPNNQGPLSYIFDSAKAHPPGMLLSTTAPKVPVRSGLPKAPTTPDMPAVSNSAVNTSINADSLVRTAYVYADELEKQAGRASSMLNIIRRGARKTKDNINYQAFKFQRPMNQGTASRVMNEAYDQLENLPPGSMKLIGAGAYGAGAGTYSWLKNKFVTPPATPIIKNPSPPKPSFDPLNPSPFLRKEE